MGQNLFLTLFCTPSKGTYAGRFPVSLQLIIASQFITFPFLRGTG